MIAVVVILGLCAISVSSGPMTVIPFNIQIGVDDVVDGNRNNSLNYKEVDKQFQENGYYEFKEFDEFRSYQNDPTLFVYRPEDSSELHGYYFSQGLYSIVTINEDDSTYGDDKEYKPFFRYIFGEISGFTPKAAAYLHPEVFSGLKLTKLVHKDEVAPEFAVVFFLPEGQDRPDFFKFDDSLRTQIRHLRGRKSRE